MKKIISIVCILLVLLTMGGCAKKLENAQPDGEISSPGGIAMQQGDWIYFINGAMPLLANDALSDTPVAKIYRMKSDGSELQAVTSKKAYNMYVHKDKIFYVTPTKTQAILYCIGIDGTKNKKLMTINEDDFVAYSEFGVALSVNNKIHYFDYETLEEKSFETGAVNGIKLSENYIYYYADNAVGTKRIEISTGNTEIICDPVGLILGATDSEAYFISTRLPYRVNTNTKELVQISETYYAITLLNMANRVLVCVESDTETQGIFTQPIDNVAGRPVGEGQNTARLQVHTKNAAALCANDEFIFFVEEETGDIYRMTFKGTEKTVLGTMQSVFGAHSMDIVGNMLFIFDSAENGNAYYVPADGSGQLTVIKEQ